MDRIAAIRESLYAFACGLVGLLPVIGIVPAILALASWLRVRAKYGTEWNPASSYLNWGMRAALLGLLGSLLLFVSLIAALLMGEWSLD